MLCFNWTVCNPESVPVLSRPLSGGRRVRRELARPLVAWKIRGRPRHGTEVGSARPFAGRHRFAQARLVGVNPLADHANPYPEVTDPICRLPLRTFFYRLEALHLGDQLRIWLQSGATPPRSPLPEFHGPRGRPGHCRNCGTLRVPNPNVLLEDSRELGRLCRSENSARVSRRRLRFPFD